MSANDRRDTLQAALALADRDAGAALAALDAVISDARSRGELSWVSLASKHAAVVAERSGDLESVIHYLLIVLGANPADAVTHFALASAYARADRGDLADASFLECLRLATENGDESTLELLLHARPDLVKRNDRPP